MHTPEFTRQAGDAEATAGSRQATAPVLGASGRLWSVAVRAGVVVALYSAYFLLGGGLQGERMPYDAGHHWELAVGFKGQSGSFSLLNFADPTRGYLAALLQLPALIVRYLTNCTMPTAAKVAGTGWAAFLFAFLIPALWQSLTRRRISNGRWLLLVLFAFVFWRDHFSFTTTDMPALALLLLALWAVSRAHIGWWLVAGVGLAGALNCRPMYLAAVVPAVLLALWWSRQHGSWLLRWLALIVGAGVALGPQLAINRLHFHRTSPLVLAQVSSNQQVPLYLKQLTWGTRVQRYDTGLHARFIYADSVGLAVLQHEGIQEYASYGQFLAVVSKHPLNYGWRYVRHLFNGLDVQQPAPYLIRPYGVEKPWLQLLNYSVLGIGVGLLLLRHPQQQVPWSQLWALFALLLPCLVALPMAMECRFLLPLHLLLGTVAAFRFELPYQWQQPRWLLVFLLVTGVWLGGCFWLSTTTTRTWVPDHGKSLVDD